jgi:hypothetical protein
LLLAAQHHAEKAAIMETHNKRQGVHTLLLGAMAAGALAAHADVVTDWNETALLAIKTDETPPPPAARALAILHTAMYDAVNGISRTHAPYLVRGQPGAKASAEAAALAAAHLVLAQLYPVQQARFDAAYRQARAAMGDTPEQLAGLAWGELVANTVLAARANDGSAGTVSNAPGTDPGARQQRHRRLHRPSCRSGQPSGLSP